MRGNERENQVWQRVQQPPGETGQKDLLLLHRQSMALAGIYRQLAGRLRGSAGELASQLYRQELESAAALLGLVRLRGGDGGSGKPPAPPAEGTMCLLRHCYARTRQVQGEYLARAVDPEAGPVFRTLAENAQGRCARIARMMGMLA